MFVWNEKSNMAKWKPPKGFRRPREKRASGLELHLSGCGQRASQWRAGSLVACMGHCSCLPTCLSVLLSVAAPPFNPSALSLPPCLPPPTSACWNIAESIFSVKPWRCLQPERTFHFSELLQHFTCTDFILWVILPMSFLLYERWAAWHPCVLCVFDGMRHVLSQVLLRKWPASEGVREYHVQKRMS